MSIFAKSGEASNESPDRQRRENTSTLARSTPDTKGEVSIIASGVRIEGDVQIEGDARIGGRITGNVNVNDRLVLAEGGIVLGAIDAGDGDIAGTVEGDVKVNGRLVIRSSASLYGDLQASNLVVEDGAAISGNCRVGKPTRLSKHKEKAGDGAAEGSPKLMLD